MSLQKTFGYVELVIGVILIFGVIIGSYFVFLAIPSNLTAKSDNLITATASNVGFENDVSEYKQPLQIIIPLLVYIVGGSYLLMFLLLGILFILQGILNIKEE